MGGPKQQDESHFRHNSIIIFLKVTIFEVRTKPTVININTSHVVLQNSKPAEFFYYSLHISNSFSSHSGSSKSSLFQTKISYITTMYSLISSFIIICAMAGKEAPKCFGQTTVTLSSSFSDLHSTSLSHSSLYSSCRKLRFFQFLTSSLFFHWDIYLGFLAYL